MSGLTAQDTVKLGLRRLHSFSSNGQRPTGLTTHSAEDSTISLATRESYERIGLIGRTHIYSGRIISLATVASIWLLDRDSGGLSINLPSAR